jgi:hypothetical protein
MSELAVVRVRTRLHLLAAILLIATGILAALPFAGESAAQPAEAAAEPAATFPLPGEAADDGGFLPRATGVEVGFNFRSWSVRPEETENFDLRQFVIPIYVYSWLRENVDFSYLLNVADSALEVGPSEKSELSGITDGKLSVNYFFPDRRFSAGLGLGLPTGESQLELEEDTVARQLAERIFGFRVKRYGEGLDVEARGTYVATFGPNAAVSLGASYLVKGDFQILDPVTRSESTYEPGNELKLLATARDRALGRDWLGRLQVTTFQADHHDGEEELKEGTEVGLGLKLREERLAGTIEIEADGLWKRDTEVVSAGGLPPSRDVGGSILRLGGGFRGKLDRLTELRGRGGVSWYGETDRGVGDGFLLEFGPGLRRNLRDGIGLDLSYTLFTGSAENGTVDLGGHDITLTFGLGPQVTP